MRKGKELRSGVRAALPLVLPTLALGASFGVLAEPVMGAVAALAMSILIFSGGAQFAALSVLQAGGGAPAATAAGLLMNARWLPMSFALAPSLRGGRGAGDRGCVVRHRRPGRRHVLARSPDRRQSRPPCLPR